VVACNRNHSTHIRGALMLKVVRDLFSF